MKDGRTTASYVITSYYDQASLDGYGLTRQPKWGHLKELHAAIKSCSVTLLDECKVIYLWSKSTGFPIFRKVIVQLKAADAPTLKQNKFKAARNNILLAVPAFLYAINNYLKFTMQLYFNPATVKMLSNLKVLVIAVLLKIIMRRRFSVLQWDALALLLIGISVNQLRSLPAGVAATDIPLAAAAYFYTLIFVTVPSLSSVYNEYALKSQYETSIYLQNLFLYGYGAFFNFLGIVAIAIFKGPSSFDILQGHSKATMLLICNNAAHPL